MAIENDKCVQGRQSNWELMRMIAMLLIIAWHFGRQSGYFESATGFNYWAFCLFGQCGIIAVNMFLILGVWFMVEARFKARRLLGLYFQLWIYVAPITVLLLVLGYDVSSKELLRSFMPFWGRSLWFVSSYLALILLAPFLHKIFTWPKKRIKKLLILSFLLTSVWNVVHPFHALTNNWMDTITWFAFIYVLIGYYKFYCSATVDWNKWKVLLLGISLYMGMAIINAYAAKQGYAGMAGTLGGFCKHWLEDYKAVPNLLISLMFCYFFQRLDIGVNKFINFWAAGAFAVYVVHQTPAFINVLWIDICKTPEWAQSSQAVLYSLLIIIGVYLSIALLDKLRSFYLQPMFMRLRIVKCLEKKMDSFYRDV